jgi:hypothetical protein
MPSIMVAIYGSGATASNTCFVAVHLFQFLYKFSAFSKHSGFASNVLTNTYVRSSGVALSNVCSELYCVQFGHSYKPATHQCSNLQYTYW